MIEIPEEVYKSSKLIHKELTKFINADPMVFAINKLMKGIHTFPLDYRFNSIFLVMDAFTVLREITNYFSIMDAFHEGYVKNVDRSERDRHISVYVNRFSSDVLYRIFSVIDKITFSYVNYFNYKDLEGTTGDGKMYEELKAINKFLDPAHPFKSGITLFLKHKDFDYWNYTKRLRNMEVHGLDPKIEAYEIKSNHDWAYSRKIPYEEALQGAIDAYETGYDLETRKSFSNEYKEKYIKEYLDLQRYEGFYYKQVQPRTRMAEYKEFQEKVKLCIKDLVIHLTNLAEGMKNCDPFKAMG